VAFEKRAAIMEYDGGLSRQDAERLALAEVDGLRLGGSDLHASVALSGITGRSARAISRGDGHRLTATQCKPTHPLGSRSDDP
jgi:hypothetical protein